MLMVRYADIGYFNNLKLKICNKLIIKGFFEIEKRKSWEIWLSQYPNMDKESYVSFDKYFPYTENDMFKQQKTKNKIIDDFLQMQQKVLDGKLIEVKV